MVINIYRYFYLIIRFIRQIVRYKKLYQSIMLLNVVYARQQKNFLQVEDWPFFNIRIWGLNQVQVLFSNCCYKGLCEQFFTEFDCFPRWVEKLGFNMPFHEFIDLYRNRDQLFVECTKLTTKYLFIFETILWFGCMEVLKLKSGKRCKIIWINSWS